jgi:hypothetical protein
MSGAHDPIWRNGFVLTRQHWQRIDRANRELGGIIIVVQGGQSGAPDSGTTHLRLGVADYRRWHMSSDQAFRTTRVLRDLCGTGHERTTWQGFDAHFHDATLGDDIPGLMDSVAIEQINGPFGYKNGGDGVSGTSGDWQPYRPDPIRNYVFLEDDMDPAERAELFRIGNKLDSFVEGELSRDEAERLRDKRRFEELSSDRARTVDLLTTLINQAQDDATKLDLRKAKERIMTWLKENPDVTGVNNPDDEQMP